MRKLAISFGVIGFVAIASSAMAEPNEAGNRTSNAIVAVSTPAPEASVLPKTCTTTTTPSGKKLCMPDADFAKRLCGGEYPDVALALMGKGTPFTRSYLTRDVDAWNATGGRTHRAKVLFDEEVMVVQYRKATGGIVMVSANGESGSYDVLRWDGSCVSVMAEEITLARPPQPKRASIPWRHLDDATKTALLAAPAVKTSYALLGKACDGNGPDKCAKAETALSSAVVDFVRNGGALPPPAHRP